MKNTQDTEPSPVLPVEWLAYIANRHKTVFDKIEDSICYTLGITEDDWEDITYVLGELSYTEMMAAIPDFLTLYDVVFEITRLLKKWLDKADNYILKCLESFSEYKESTKLISILWKVNNYKYGYSYTSTGFRKGWHLTSSHWAYKY